jgi:hypothetical protein
MLKKMSLPGNQVLIIFFALTIAVLTGPANLSFAQMHGGGGGGMGPGGGGGGGMQSTTLSTFTTEDFSGSGVCAFCHSNLTDSVGNDVSIDAHWRSTMMANAGKDPLWQAKISSEIQRNPALQPVIEEKCSRCHMGMARYQAITDGSPVGVLSPGFLDPNNLLHAAAMDGVSCTLCHQIQAQGLGTPDSFTGQYLIDTLTSAPNRLAFGPYGQPVANPMEMNSGFSPTLGSQVRGAALCGSCHTLYTPTVDAFGNVLPKEFPEQTTYLEWKFSNQSRTCQDCHLPEAVGGVAISNRPMWLAPRTPFGQHHFVGGNSFMVNLLKTNATQLGVTADAAHSDATIARTDALLQNSTAALSLVSASISNGFLTLDLKVQNLAGHKFPSGIPARRAWLHLTVTDSRGRSIFESGKPLADGSIAGNDADVNALTFEPHYDLITSADQVQIYEPIMLDSGAPGVPPVVTHTLLRAASYAKDNRLLPAGFDKGSASEDIAVWGEAASDSNFTAGEDRITYRLAVPSKTRSFTVTAELLYQSVSHSFAEDMRQDGTDLVNRFFIMYDPASKTPRVVAKIQKTVQ